MPSTSRAVTVRPSGPAHALVPASLAEARTVGALMAASRLFTDATDGAKAVVKVLAGRELGLGAYASMTGIYFVKGRVTLSANVMGTVIQNSGRFRFRVRKHTRAACVIAFQEYDAGARKWEDVGESSFDAEDARLAGLGTGDNWKKYPRNMLYARAMSNGAKWYCPGAFSGHTPYTPDEVDGRAAMTDEGEYLVDGVVVQSVAADAPAQPGEVPSPAGGVRGELDDLISATNTDPEVIAGHYGAADVRAMTDDDVDAALKILRVKKNAQ